MPWGHSPLSFSFCAFLCPTPSKRRGHCMYVTILLPVYFFFFLIYMSHQSEGATWRHTKFDRRERKKSSLTPSFLQWHHCCQFHLALYFKLMCACLYERNTNRCSLYVIQCLKAPIPISMIISYSAWAKTAALIQFISLLLTGAEMLGLAEVHSEVFCCWGDGEFVLGMGGKSCSAGHITLGAMQPWQCVCWIQGVKC